MKTIFATLFILGAAMMMNSSAYQYAGGSITYTNLGGYQYQILLTVYTDCAGGIPPFADTINIASSCGTNFSVVANQISSSSVPDTICKNALTTCQGGSVAGIQKVQYSVTLALPPGCANWTFSFHDNYRNCAITTISTGCYYPIYLEAKVFNLSSQNNSVHYNTDAVIFTCKNQPLCFNVGAIDPDTDSLVYSLIAPRYSAVSNVAYISPNTYSSPLVSTPPLTLNSATGQICFTPTKSCVTIMSVLIQEFRGGFVIGQTVRDIEINVANCAKPVLNPILTPTSNNFTYTGNDTIKLCKPVKIDFSITSGDSDATDSISMSWNRGNLPTQAFMSFSGKPIKGSFDWSATTTGTFYFSVTVTAINCFGQNSITVNYVIIASNPTATVLNTVNSCNATATVYPSGGNGYYLYQWSPGSLTTQTIPIGSSGTYQVKVTDAGGCTVTASTSVSVGYTLSTSFTPTACTQSTGTASVTLIGGVLPYTYQWNTGATTTTITGLSAGIYTVSVTDSVNCVRVTTISVAQSGPSLSLSSTATGCGQPTGTASVIAYNGAYPYTYSWSNGQITGNATGLSAGTVTVTVTDANQCYTIGSITITTTNAPTASFSSSAVSCWGGNNGSANIYVTGTSPFTYLWSNGATIASINGLSTGVYGITVTDGAGCTVSAQGTVSQPPPILISATSGQTGCNAQSGTISVSPSGGNPPNYSYKWSTGQITSTITGLSTGTYVVTVTDNRSCSGIASITITQPAAMSLSTSATSIGCAGSASVSITGGASPYTYKWNVGQTTSTATYLSTGTYFVTVIDANGCTASSSVSLTATQGVNASINGTTSICSGQPAMLTATGGTTYTWSTGATTDTISVLIIGTYSVTVTNSSGCTGIATTTVTLNHLTLNFKRSYIICEAGSVQLTASGGTTYSWLPSSGLNCTSCPNPVANPTSTTTYTVTIASGACSDTATVIVYVASSPLPPHITVGPGDTLFSSTSSTYQWFFNGSPIPNATQSFYLAVSCGVYSVLITDSNGCSSTSSGINVCTGINTASTGNIIVYPNPVRDKITVYGLYSKPATIEIYNVMGEKVISVQFFPDKAISDRPLQTSIDLSNLVSGVYIIKVQTYFDASGNEMNKFVSRIVKQ